MLTFALLVLPNWSPTWSHQFICRELPLISPTLDIFILWDFANQMGEKCYTIINLHVMTTKEVEHLCSSVTQFVIGCWPLCFLLYPFISPVQLFFTCLFLNWDACLFLTDLLEVSLEVSCVQDHNGCPLWTTNDFTWSVFFFFSLSL